MYRASSGLRSTQNQDGTLVLDIEHGRIFRLNTTGSAIFDGLKVGQTSVQIIERISQTFGIAREIAQRDVSDFLKSMEEAGLVRNDADR